MVTQPSSPERGLADLAGCGPTREELPEEKGDSPAPPGFITHVLPSIPSTGDNDVLCLNESRATRLAGESFPDHGLESPGSPPNPPLRLCRAGSGSPLPARF